MLINPNNNEGNENNKVKTSNYGKIFRKVDLQIKLSKSPQKKHQEKTNDIKLPFLQLNKEVLGRKMNHLKNFCNSIYSIYSHNNNNKSVNSIGEIYNAREHMHDILNDSKLKAIADIKHYFYINKFPNEVNFRKNNTNDLYKKLYTTRARVKPVSLKKIKLKEKINNEQNNNQDEEKFSLITTLDVKKEKKEKNKIGQSIDSYTNRNKKFNFEDYASNQIINKHPVLYQLNQIKNKGNNLPSIKIHRRNKIFNDIVEMSKLIPDNTEINKEYKKNNYDDYMRMKELKIIK